MSVLLMRADARRLPLADGSVDAVVTDPPYPEISRDYGRMSEADWHDMMRSVVAEVRRVLKPRGSAVFILQPNSERVGRMRPWLWEFMAWTAREWNQVQDAWWWNHAAIPTVHCNAAHGLMRPSVKAAVWLGAPDCYRDQASVLWQASDSQRALNVSDRALTRYPSGHRVVNGRFAETVNRRGGVTPLNLLPCANTAPSGSAGALGHGAGTAATVAAWWIRYISPPGGVVLDPFCGSGTVPREALALGRRAIGSDVDERYVRDMAAVRTRNVQPCLHLGGAA